MSKAALKAWRTTEVNMLLGKYTRRKNQDGFTLLAVLFAMLLVALGSQSVMTYLSEEARRASEAQLLQIGNMYVQAIGSYYQASPGVVKQWPRSLNQLTLDPRFVTIKRHIRQVYADPMSGSQEWGIVASPEGGIAGVYSLSTAQPLQTAGATVGSIPTDATQYSDWRFVYQPPIVQR
jgi:type II secretory pathway pseudopilin PulG